MAFSHRTAPAVQGAQEPEAGVPGRYGGCAVVSKHTPGPWQYVFEGGTTAFITESDGSTIICIRTTENTTAHKNLAANARLIAAAPDLLSLAKLVLRGLESGAIKARPTIDIDLDAEQVDMRPLAVIARAAIAKAEGKLCA